MIIRVLVYRVGQPPTLEEIDNELPALQAIVGGYIECVWLMLGIALVCNEEGKLRGLRPNRFVDGLGTIHGDFFIAKTAGSEFVSLSDDAAEIAKLLVGDLRRRVLH